MVVSFLLYVLSFLGLFSSGALCTLYPVKPVSGTVYSAGMPAQVKWVEDNRKPFLNSTGTMQIDLYAGKNTYLATIAKNLDPTTGSTTVFIPSFVPGNYHAFVLRFITTAPPQTIYTADFAIIPNPASISIKSAPPPPTRTVTASVTAAAGTATGTGTNANAASAKGTGTSTAISRVMGTAGAAGAGSGNGNGNGNGSGNGGGGGVGNNSDGSSSGSSSSGAERNSAGSSSRRTRTKAGRARYNADYLQEPGIQSMFAVDTEKMKFRIVFIVWPTLVGLSMAL